MSSNDKIRVDNEKINCRSCNKQLYGVLIFDQTIPAVRTGFKTMSNVYRQVVEANCPHCNDQAWTQKYETKIMLSPYEGLYFKNIDQEVINDELMTKIEIGIQNE
jgi:hypothetical protein